MRQYNITVPAAVRYDSKLSANAKLIYGEIQALSKKTGHCNPSNHYFANLYNRTPDTVSMWIAQLKKTGYIRIRYTKKGAEIQDRTLTIIKNFSKSTNRKNPEEYILYKYNTYCNNILLSKDNNRGDESPVCLEEFLKTNFSPIKNELLQYFNLYKKLHPKALKKRFFSPDKIKKINILIRYLIKGFPNHNYNILKDYVKDNNYGYDPLKGFGDIKIIKKMFTNAMLCIHSDYLPENKKNITNNVEDFIMNSFNNFSFFFTYGWNPPKKIKQAIQQKKNKYPKYTKQLAEILNQTINNDIINYINRLVLKHKQITENAIKHRGILYTRNMLEPLDNPDPDYNTYIRKLDSFMALYFRWLEEQLEKPGFKFQYNYFNNNFLLFSGYVFIEFDKLSLFPDESVMQYKLQVFFRKKFKKILEK